MEKLSQKEIVMQPENVAERVELLKAMDVVVRSLNDESVMDLWLTNGVPDGADDSDYEFIAEDVATPEDEDGDTSCFEETCRCFTACIAAGAKHGYYSGGVLGDIRPVAKIKKSIATWANIQTEDFLFRWYVESLNMSGVVTSKSMDTAAKKVLKYIKGRFLETGYHEKEKIENLSEDDIQVWIDCLDDDYDENNDGVLVVNY
jgi:hypothetical protein